MHTKILCFAFLQFLLAGKTYGFSDCWVKSCELLENLQTSSSEIISKQGEHDASLASLSSKLNFVRKALRPDSELNSRVAEILSTVTTIENELLLGSDSNVTDNLAAVATKIINAVLNMQAVLQTNVDGVTQGVNNQTSASEENVRNDLLVCESNILGGLQDTENIISSLILSAIATSENNVVDAIQTSQTDTEDAIKASKNKIISDISSAVDTSESNVIGAVDISETNIVNAVGTSESNIESAITSSETDIISAVGTSESSVISAVDTAKTAVTTAVGASEDTVVDTIVNSEANVTGIIGASEANVLAAVGTSEGNVITSVNATVETSEANVIALINSKCGFAPVSAYVDNSNLQEIQIELDIFTGIPNPTWTVTNDTGEFETLKSALTGAKSSPRVIQLGYRGFVVTTIFDDGTIVYRTYGPGGQDTTSLETLLLNSNGGTLSSDVIAIAAAGINGLSPPDIGTVDSLTSVSLGSDTCGNASPCVEPAYNIDDWTSASESSYNYAVNSATGTYAQPGRGAGSQFLDLTGKAVRGAAVLDGLKDHSDEAAGDFPTTNNCLLVLAIIPGVDFHFFRRDSNNKWSHKLGPHPPTNLDNAGNKIRDPRTADIAPYKYQRFMSVCPKRVSIA